MAYLPGVPDVGPAPVSTAPAGARTSIGKPQGIAAVAHGVGKPGRVEHLGTVVGRHGAGLTSVGGGNQALHSLGHYGKAPPLLGGSQLSGGVDPTAHPGAKMVRGSSGAMRSHVREGGLGPGRLGAPGPDNTDYSIADNQDTE